MNNLKKHSILLCTLLFLSPIISFAGISTPSLNQNNQWQGAVVYSMFKTMGSGVPVSQCHVLTNEHVVRGSKKAHVVISSEKYRAKVVSVDNDNDMALLKIDDCPIKHFAKVAKIAPKKGDTLTSVYYKPGFNFFRRMIKSKGTFIGFGQILTEEDKAMTSMMIDDPHPKQRSSGGGISSEHGLVSVIFGIASKYTEPTTYAVSYDALKSFLVQNHIR